VIAPGSRMKHRTSVGRVLEVFVESSSTDAHAYIHTDKEARLRPAKEGTFTLANPCDWKLTGGIELLTGGIDAGINTGIQDQYYDIVTLTQPANPSTIRHNVQYSSQSK